MTTTADGYTPQDWTGRLSPSDVHHVLFSRARLGRRGYDELEVDGFLERVQQELTRLISEKADLRDEVARLKSQLAQAPATAPVADGVLSHEEANLQAVRLLAAAQQTADVYVADAEKYSQRLTTDAREHAEQMLDEARRAAKKVIAEAERAARDAAPPTIEGEVVSTSAISKEELDEQVAYLKTFGQVVRVQLRSYLEALLRDVEEEWGRADPTAAKELGGGHRGPRGLSGPGEATGPAPAPAAQDTPAQDTPAQDTPAQDTPAQDTPALGSGEERGTSAPESTPTADSPPEASANGSRSRGRSRTTSTVVLP